MSLVKYRIKEVAADFGMAPKDVSQVVEKFFEKPKSPSQVLSEEELNVVFDYITQTNQISSLEVVFAVQPKPKAEEAPKTEEKTEAKVVAPEVKEEVKKENEYSQPVALEETAADSPAAKAAAYIK